MEASIDAELKEPLVLPPPFENAALAVEIATSGAGVLASLVRPTGQFIYAYEPAAPDIQSPKYNALRHAGSAWSMFDVARHLGPLPSVVTAASAAVQFMKAYLLKPFGGTGALCMVDGERVKLGGAGLAMLALLDHYHFTQDDSSLQAAKALAEYIALERLPNGDFVHSRRYPTLKTRPFHSDYYVGEVLFGLARLHTVTNDARWLDLASDSAYRLSSVGYGIREQSHWMLYALAELNSAAPHRRWMRYAGRIAEDIIKNPAYRETQRSTPAACRSEGLLAYARMLGGDAPATGTALESVLATVRQDLALQLKHRLPDGAFMCGGGKETVRIDYIQHNISAFMAYHRFETRAAL